MKDKDSIGCEFFCEGLCHQENGLNEEFGISMTQCIFCKDNPTCYYKQLQAERQELEQLKADYKYSQDELRASKNRKKLYGNRVSELFRENTTLKEQLEEQIENGIDLVMDSRKQENIIKTKLDYIQNNLNSAVEALEQVKIKSHCSRPFVKISECNTCDNKCVRNIAKTALDKVKEK